MLTLDLPFLLTLFVELTAIFVAVTFLVDLIQSRLGPERMRSLLQTSRTPLRGMVAAAFLGALTPFCSCSTVPLVAAMRQVGVALPVLATFLIISPLVNPATVALLATLVSPLYALLFVVAAFAIALTVGGLAFLVPATPASALPMAPRAVALLREEAPLAVAARDSLGMAWRGYVKLLPVFAVAALVGALLHNQVAAAWIQGALSGTDWWMVPAAALIGIPVYASTGILLPLGTALYTSGVNLGVVTAFLMGATGFSIPEGILLHKLLGTRLLALFLGAFAVAVILVGYGFQALTFIQ